jgi:hypothetical protein
MKKILTTAFFFILLIAFRITSFAQPFTLDERIQPIELNLVDYKKTDNLKKGKINVTNVAQVKDTLYYFVKGLSMYSPVYFGLTTKADSGNIKVYLCKDNWKAVNKQGETGSKAHWDAKFKTEGDFGIMVVPERKPANYTLVVWAGNEAKDVGIASPFTGGTAADKKSSGGNFLKDNLMYIIIGLLVAIIAILMLKRKK